MTTIKCDCGSSDLLVTDKGFRRDTGEPWTEYECQECGSMFFVDEGEEKQ